MSPVFIRSANADGSLWFYNLVCILCFTSILSHNCHIRYHNDTLHHFILWRLHATTLRVPFHTLHRHPGAKQYCMRICQVSTAEKSHLTNVPKIISETAKIERGDCYSICFPCKGEVVILTCSQAVTRILDLNLNYWLQWYLQYSTVQYQ